MAINEQKLHELLGKGVNDFGATFHAALISIGDKLGLYKGLAAGGTQTPGELAKRTGTTERYVREWLCNQAAGGYVTYDAASGKFSLSEEQAFALADDNSPAFLPGAFQVALGAIQAKDQLEDRFKTGKGMGWHEHHANVFVGTERFFRPGYAANLIAAWIPALEGVDAKLKAGAKVADVGCGLGASRWGRDPKRGKCQVATRRQNHGALDHVLELADVAGPRVVTERLSRLARDHVDVAIHARGKLADEVIDERVDVRWPLTEGRYRDREDIQAVVQIVTEASPIDHPGEVPIRGGD